MIIRIGFDNPGPLGNRIIEHDIGIRFLSTRLNQDHIRIWARS